MTWIVVACASIEFSRSSFKAFDGRWIISYYDYDCICTSPAAILFTTVASSFTILPIQNENLLIEFI